MSKKSRKPKVSGPRTVRPEIKSDKQASNLLAEKSKNYENANDKPRVGKNRVYKPKKGQTQHQIMLRNAKHKKKQRIYSEKELNLPKLNKSIDPEGIKRGVRGKKGKVFAEDDDVILRIANQVDEAQNSVNASKLEKARQLEEIREQKRLEIEKKEQEREEKLQEKKSQLKKRNKKKSTGDEKVDTKKKKRVSFA